MTPYENIKKLVADYKPSMRWDGNEPLEKWQERARKKLSELLGLDAMIPAEKAVEIEFDREWEEFREIRFRYQSEPGYFVPCHMLIPNGAKLPLATVICMQGHSKGMHITLGRTKYPGEEIAGDRDFAIRAVKEGFIAVALEQRDFGECGGNEKGPQCLDPSLTNLLIGRTTIGERVWDVMRCVDVLLDDFAELAKPDEIYVLGNSGGGTCSIYAGALETRLAGSVPSCAISSFAASIGAMSHCACNYVPNILKYFDMSELIAMNAPRKLVVVSGEKDSIFPIAEARKMVAIGHKAYDAVGASDRIAHVVGGEGHRFYADIAWDALKKMK
ncbi:MAG: hypothetical protein HFE63_08505 [Clostridiales bacterium]|nr:hypothetical protein [Clostridiales bacterium]